MQTDSSIAGDSFVTLSMLVVVIAIALVAMAVAGIAIKMLVKKDGQFAGTCSSNNPLLQNDDGACSICGARSNQKCKG